jgi:O-antigen/teichoic acid export membrane protein
VRSSDQGQFSTDHLLDDLKRRAVSSGAITVGAQAAKFGLNLGGLVVLARVLTPEDFGLIAMVSAVIGFVRIFRDAGLPTATVQREGITHAQVSNLFWINALISAGIGLVLVVASPLVAWFYGEPRLVGITVALCLGGVMSGLTGQHMALLSRQMRFGAVARIDIASLGGGLVVGVAMSLLRCRYWSLVGMNLATAVIGLWLAWSACGWRPQRPTRGSGISTLITFGFNLTAGGFVYSMARGIDSVLIGRIYGADLLGLYSRASAMLARPLEQFVGPVEAVFVPAFSRLQGQEARYRRVFLLVYEALALIGALFTGLLLGLAHPMTLVVLGHNWEAASTIFAGFAAVALFVPLCSACSWLMTSQGRGRDSLVSSVVVSGVTVTAFVAGIPWGPAGVATAYSISGFLVQIPVVYYIAGRQGPVSTRDLWTSTVRQLPVWLIVSATAWLVGTRWVTSAPLVQFVVGTAAGLVAGIVYISLSARSRVVARSLIEAMRHLPMFRVRYGT